MKTLFDFVAESKTASIEAYLARRAAIEAAYSEGNHNIPVNVDRMGRFHAPVDGYIIPSWLANRVEAYYEDKLFGKGEYLPVPIYDEDEISFTGGYSVKLPSHRVLANNAQLAEITEAAKTEAFKFDCGKEWQAAQGTMRYVYLQSPSKRIVNIIKFYITAMEVSEKKTLEEKRAEEKATAGVAPTGRQMVKGTVLSQKAVQSDYGVIWKMMVKLENGSTVYGTIPSALPEFDNGATVEFTATFEHAAGDDKHAFYKRPSKAKLV